MSNPRAECAIQCHYCARTLSITPSAQAIRCYQCKEINSVRENQKSTTSTTTSNGTNRKVCEEQNNNNIHSEAKWQLHNPFRKKSFNSNSPRAVSPSNKGMDLPMESISEWKVTPGKRALLCGVSYNKQKFRLKGTINDVESMKKLLVDHFKFSCSSIHILTEEKKYHSPTKKNIQEALKWLVKDCKSGDSLVFYFSGHGLRQPDFDQDERDGFDETICPVDFRTAGMILDNELNDTIVKPLTEGVTLHAIIDACHSGTVLDLPYIYNTKENKWEDNRPPSGVKKDTNGGLAISFSACEDDQLATDTTAFPEEMASAMTYTFKRAIECNPKITYVGLLTSRRKAIKEANDGRCFNKLREIFHRKNLQEPMLSSSDPEFDVNLELKL